VYDDEQGNHKNGSFSLEESYFPNKKGVCENFQVNTYPASLHLYECGLLVLLMSDYQISRKGSIKI
jgi:hypothetical protein